MNDQTTVCFHVLQSVCGISIVGQDPVAANDFNIRELQKKVTQAEGENGAAAIAPTASVDDGSVSGSDSEVVVIDADDNSEGVAGVGETAMDRNEAVTGNKRGREEEEAAGEKEDATPNGKKAREETTGGAEEEKVGEGDAEGAAEDKPSRRSSCTIM